MVSPVMDAGQRDTSNQDVAERSCLASLQEKGGGTKALFDCQLTDNLDTNDANQYKGKSRCLSTHLTTT